MGKATFKGFVPPDDPMFSTGPEIFSRPESSASSKISAKSTAGATPAKSNSADAERETEAEGKELGARRISRFKHQNEQFRKKR